MKISTTVTAAFDSYVLATMRSIYMAGMVSSPMISNRH